MQYLDRNTTRFLACMVLILALQTVSSLAQTGVIIGKVSDATTSEPLPFTHVFIDQTTVGTVTDENGSYTLNNVPVGVNEIVYSFVGYKPYQTRIQIKEGESKQLDIRLQSDDMQLEAVEVKGTRDKQWNKQLKKFEKIFLGTTRFSGATNVLNSWVIDFKEVAINGKEIFTATASQPLEIENLSLGYKVYYYLNSMASNSDGYNIIGKVRFEEMTSADPKTLKTWNQNRLEAYHGSLRHLIKSMVEGKAQEEGFNLYIGKSGYENTPFRSAVFASQLDKSMQAFSAKSNVLFGKTEDEFAIELKQRLEIHYTKERTNVKVYSDINYPVSWLQVNGGILRANAKGMLLNPSNAIVSGAMYEARVADLLPNNNYSPDQTQTTPLSEIETPMIKKLRRLEEKVYLQTDKPYYYPGEKIWFKAYMNYKTPELIDSLSRVLYVELIGPDKSIDQTKIIFLDGGSGAGSLDLPNVMVTGDYILRAYTNWMLNYNYATIFSKTIPVLGLYEWPEITTANPVEPKVTAGLIFHTDQSLFHTRQPIALGIELRNEKGIPMSADLSISITDINRVVEVPEVKNILTDFSFSSEQANQNLTNEIKYPVEYSINLSGQYKNRKGKPEKSSFILVVDSLKSARPVETDSTGNFFVSGFIFYDSVNIGFQTTEKKNKPGKVTLQSREVASTALVNAERLFNRVTMQSAQRVMSSPIKLEKGTRLLDEVVIESKPILNKEIVPNTYGRADFTISGDDIVRSSRTSLFDALRARVPGFGQFGPGSFGVGSLLIIDGVQISNNNIDINRIYEMLSQINPEIVERVDVMKYGSSAAYGLRGAGGVIVVTTKSGEYGTVNNSPTYITNFFQQAKVKGFSKVVPFSAPDYSKGSWDIMDKRSTIYWNADVTTDPLGRANFLFYSADTPSVYKIIVEGVSALGEPVRGVFYIDVVN